MFLTEMFDKVNEDAEGLNIGDPVIIVGNVQYKGKTGEIVEFGKDKRFVIVDLYNYGRHSFHSSDVEFNDYADSDEEANDWQEREMSEASNPEVDAVLAKIAASGNDGYDMIYSGLNGSFGKAVETALQNMYDDISINHRLHPDDNFEEIQGIMMDYIEADYGQGVAEGETPEKEIERLKLRQNAEHGKASLKRQAETQARIRELEKQRQQGVAEGSKMAKYNKHAKAAKPKNQQEYDAIEKYKADLAKSYQPKKQQGVAESRVDPILYKALVHMPAGLTRHNEILDAAYDAYALEVGKLQLKHNYGVTNVYVPKLMDLYKEKHGAGVSEESIEEGAVKDLYTDLSDKYSELAPKIEKYKDSYLAGELYDALEEIAAKYGAMKEFRSMLNGARNRAHMDYDTNPGGFQNWFWYLPFADDEQ